MGRFVNNEGDLEFLSPQGRALVDTLKCPVAWLSKLLPEPEPDWRVLADWLNRKWVTHVSSSIDPYQLASHFFFTDDDLVDTIDSYGGVSLTAIRLELGNMTDLANLIEQASQELQPLRESFAARYDVHVWRDLHLATRDHYSKHFMHQGADQEAAMRSTREKGSASLILPDVEPRLSVVVIRALDELARVENFQFLDSIPTATHRVWVNTTEPVGFSGGRDTSFVCIQIDGSTGLVHCFPVVEEEVRSYLKVEGPLPDDDHTYPFVWFSDFQALSGDEEYGGPA